MAFTASDPDVFNPGSATPVPGQPGDVCPQGWELDFDRSQMSTQVLINRRTITPPDPKLHWTLTSSTGAPGAGEITVNNDDLRLATTISISSTAAGGVSADMYLRNLTNGATLQLADKGHSDDPVTTSDLEAQIDRSDGLRWSFRALYTGLPAADYDWVIPGGNPATADNQQSVSVVYATPGTKTATLNVGGVSTYDITVEAVVGATNSSIGYGITGAPTAGAGYWTLPVTWISGQQIRDGDIELTLNYFNEPPDLYIDTFGRDYYGEETFTRTDLINVDRTMLPDLADRILEIRGSNSVPRVEAVTIDARTAPDAFPNRNAELMVNARPEKPSRYRLRLKESDGRQIFDRMCFATTVRHFIRNDEWTLRISFDVAEWAAQL